MKRIAVVALLLLAPAIAKADSIWLYDGQVMDPGTWHGDLIKSPCQCSLDGVMVFDDNFKVLAYSWTDGTHTLNQNNSTIVFENNPTTGLFLGHDPNTWPPLATWLVSITGGDVFLHSNYDGPGQGATSIDDSIVGGEIFGWGQQASGPWPGTWTEVATIPTPEPSGVVLLLIGVLGVLALRFQNRREHPSSKAS
jgi:hypothetical protein